MLSVPCAIRSIWALLHRRSEAMSIMGDREIPKTTKAISCSFHTGQVRGPIAVLASSKWNLTPHESAFLSLFLALAVKEDLCPIDHQLTKLT